MGDVWPCHGPWRVTWQEAYNMIYFFTHSNDTGEIMAAIGSAESSLDLAVINDTPATGDYSVGVWQINYYGSLYASRARQFGTPCQLVNSGLGGQARAALAIADTQGYTAWSTYNSGAYKKFLHGFVNPQGPPGGGSGQLNIPPAPGPGRDDYSPTMIGVSGHLGTAGQSAYRTAVAIRDLRR